MRVAIGAMIEIRTTKGLAYAQVTHRHSEPPTYGTLLRVFRGFHKERPSGLSALAKQPLQFSTFYPVSASAKVGLVEIVGKAEVSVTNAAFPMFKDGIENPETGEVAVWWLWDGSREWRVGEYTPDLDALPYREIITGDVLTRRIEAAWTSAGRGRFGSPPIS